ncbi:MAG: hypothetical protein DRG83_21210 [Deltaproteobacteria bacterium]|nr:MAG: hypothetical protein DRG83_21210 [Deltaproteobacteria bacterium]
MNFYEQSDLCKIRRTCSKILKVLGEIKEDAPNRRVGPAGPIQLPNGDELYYTAAARERDIGKFCKRLGNGRWLCRQKSPLFK